MNEEEAMEKLCAMGQGHLLHYWDTLDKEKRNAFVAQIATIDSARLIEQREFLRSNRMYAKKDRRPYERYDVPDASETCDPFSAISDGKVGCLLVAGGQATRLGISGPKGAVPISVITNKSLFELFAEKVIAAGRRVGRELSLAIMTSPLNHDETVEFFESNSFFGMKKENLSFFKQGMLPLLDDAGDLFLEGPGKIAVGPDGNGSVFENFYLSGVWDKWNEKGIEHVNILLVDNALAMPYDPRLIEEHLKYGGEITVQCVRKDLPEEKLGIMAMEGDKAVVVEYTELDDDDRESRDSHGNLMYGIGHIGVYLISMTFIKKIALKHENLPFHLAHKRAPMIGGDCMAWKFEQFMFDALPLAQRVNVVVFPREHCFAPLKNKGGDDSIDTVKKALQKRDREIFEKMFGRKSVELVELSQEFYYPTYDLAELCKKSTRIGGYITSKTIVPGG